MYIIGKTGMGKSTLMENLIMSNIRAGEGVALIDPHGDLAEHLVGILAAGNAGNITYFNPGEASGRLGFNILEPAGVESYLVVSGVVSVFKKIWSTLKKKGIYLM